MSGGKRWRVPNAKPGEIKIVYGKADRYSDPDICVAWGDGVDMKPTARFVMNALDQKRMAINFPNKDIEYRPSVIEELVARGFDITTIRFSIERLAPPPAVPSTEIGD